MYDDRAPEKSTLVERMVEIAQILIERGCCICNVEIRNCRGSPIKRTFGRVTRVSYDKEGILIIVGRNEDETQAKSIHIKNPTEFNFTTKPKYARNA